MLNKKLLLFFLLVHVFYFNVVAQKELNVMTYNIRYDTPRDSLNPWSKRKDMVTSQILFHQVDVLGVQEALHRQMLDLQMMLPAYKSIGVGREDGKTKGEYSAIFYNTVRLKLLEGSTFWLSENPDSVGKKGWDAALPRIVTWAKFRDLKTKKTFFVFNTHFDHMGKVARRQSSKLLLEKVKNIAGKLPVIITGDFNAHPADEPITALTDKSIPHHFINAKEVTASPHYGPTGTSNNFGPKEVSNDPIDYIFIKNGIQVLQHATLSQTWQGKFSSDHFPVFARVMIK